MIMGNWIVMSRMVTTVAKLLDRQYEYNKKMGTKHCQIEGKMRNVEHWNDGYIPKYWPEMAN